MAVDASQRLQSGWRLRKDARRPWFRCVLCFVLLCGVGLCSGSGTVGIIGDVARAQGEAPRGMKLQDMVQRWEHPSGATIFLLERHDVPYLNFEVSLQTGSLWDPEGREGLAAVSGELMTRGAGSRSRKALEEELDFLGADIDASIAPSSLSWSGDFLSRNKEKTLALFADIFTSPLLLQEELDRLKREKESDILQIRDTDRELNQRFFDRYLWGDHPYGRPSDGTRKGISKIERVDVQQFYRKHVVASNMILGFAGDITREELDTLLEGWLAKMPRGTAPPLKLPALPSLQGRQVLLVDKPERTQNQLLLGHLAPVITHKDRDALEVIDTIFGGTFTARLNSEVRDKRGLSYGAYSYLDADHYAGTFSLWTFPAAEDGMKTISLVLDLLETLRREPLTQEEVTFAKKYLVNSFAFRLDSPEKILEEVIEAEIEGRGLEDLDTYVARMDAVTLAQVQSAVERHISPENLLLVMLCTAARFEESVRALPHVTTVKIVAHDTDF